MNTKRPPAVRSEAPQGSEQGRADDADTHDTGRERGSTTGPPRWVMVVVIVIAALVLLGVVLLHLSGGLGPGLHGGS